MDTLERLVEVFVVSGSACLPFLLFARAEVDSKVWDDERCLVLIRGGGGVTIAESFGLMTGSVFDLGISDESFGVVSSIAEIESW